MGLEDTVEIMADDRKLAGEFDSNDEPVESLAKGRAHRSTAGKHMSELLDAEADDELALLFAEDEDDEEFASEPEEAEGDGGDDGDDMEIDSSSEDDEDPGPNAPQDELQGEKELEKQARDERLAKKRKAQEGLRLTALRKKVKINPTILSKNPMTPATRPKKKSERISWLPTQEDGP